MDTPDIAALAQENGKAPEEYIAVPVELANRALAILAQLPYHQVADVVNELRSLEVRNDDPE